MSFTQAEHLFAGVNEVGFNELLKAFFTARPRHLHHVTPPFVTATTSQSVTVHPAFSDPTFQITIDYELHFTLPVVDINPDGGVLTAPGEFTVLTQVSGNVLVFGWPPMPVPSVQMSGVCEPVVTVSQPGTGIIGINVKSVTPPLPGLAAVLQTILGDVKIPYDTMTLGSYKLGLLVGPKSENNQIEVRGSAL